MELTSALRFCTWPCCDKVLEGIYSLCPEHLEKWEHLKKKEQAWGEGIADE